MIPESRYNHLVDHFRKMDTLLRNNLRGLDGQGLLNRYKQTLRVVGHPTWEQFIKENRSRDGFSMKQRFDGWASNSPFPAVPFVVVDGNDKLLIDRTVVVLTPIQNNVVQVASRDGDHIVVSPCYWDQLIPVFTNKLGASPKVGRELASYCGDIVSTYKKNGNLHKPVDPRETRDDLYSGTTTINTDALGRKYNTTSDDTLDAARYTQSKTSEEKSTMKNVKADNFIQDQKAIATQIAKLNAGRVSNKVVKEAMRPLVALLFKPTWTQKLAMKVTGAKNPLDEFMNTQYADLLCAQLFKVVIDMREVDNKHVKDTANSAVVYAGLKVTEQLPVEDLIDQAIAKVSEATAGAFGKKDVSDT